MRQVRCSAPNNGEFSHCIEKSPMLKGYPVMKTKRMLTLTLCLIMALGSALTACQGGTGNTVPTDQATESLTSPSETESNGAETGNEEDTEKCPLFLSPRITFLSPRITRIFTYLFLLNKPNSKLKKTHQRHLVYFYRCRQHVSTYRLIDL